MKNQFQEINPTNSTNDIYMFLFLFLSVSDAMTGHYNEERKSMLYHIIDSSCLPNIFASYAFTKCVKKKLSEKVGCKLPWDNQTAGDARHAAHLDHDDPIKRRFERHYGIEHD